MSQRALVVSLHDVSPHTHEACARIVAALEECGVTRVSLLVIPDHHSRGHFRDAPDFCAWLRELESRGHEIVTHGYFHRRARREKESVVQRLTTRVYTADEGEFYDIDRATARELVERANDELRAVGLHPRGFIAPAWLLSDEGEAALREIGCEYTTRLRTVSDLQRDRCEPSQSLCWSVRAAWRRAVSLLWNATLYRRLENAPLLRISIHPVDIHHPSIWSQISRLVGDACGSREPMTYIDWIESQRTQNAPTTIHA